MNKAAELINLAADVYGVTPDQIKQRTRIRHVTHARQLAMYLIKARTDMSLNQIGKLLGGYDHTTVMYSIETAAKRIDRDPSITAIIAEVLGSQVLLDRTDPIVKQFLAECGV